MESPLRRMKVDAHLLYGMRMGAEYSAEWFCIVKMDGVGHVLF